MKIKNNESLINDLNKTWIVSYHLYAAMAKFEKNHNTTTKSIHKSSFTKTNDPSKQVPHFTYTNPNQSYVNVHNGNDFSNTVPKPSKPTNILKSVTLDVSDLINTSCINNVVLVKVRDARLIPNINTVLNKEGFYEFQCKYIRGMWLWIEFESNEACLKLQENKEMSWYFTHLKHIQHNFILDERVVWIEIGGLPLNAWTPNAFKKIAESWGDPLFVDEDPNEIVSIGRVCIKTKIHGHINETCKVIILDKAYNVSVKEFAGWTPDIKSMDATFGYNSESDKSEKLEEALDENGPFDKEEGEIPKDEPNEEHEFNINTQWADADVNRVPKQENFSTEFPTSPVAKNEKEESSSFSKPPGFEAYFSNSNCFPLGGNRRSPKQPFHFSSAPVKSSRVTKSQTKSFGNHGSMIEAFVLHIETGKVLGYDMEGSKNDLKKFIDSLGVKQETYSIKMDIFKIKCIWGNSQFEFIELPASGRSGGLASIWDPNAFYKVNEFHFEHLLTVE
nr:RNA-directed DNA polymerase, eukaryota [Tanacetum cinerariifolium]